VESSQKAYIFSRAGLQVGGTEKKLSILAESFLTIERVLVRAIIPALSLLVYSGSTDWARAGSAVLSWTAPTTNTDGSALTDLAGYKIYYGTASGAYGTPIDAGSAVGSPPGYTVNNLGIGTYYFAVTAYDTAGRESAFSNETSKTFAAEGPVISAVNAGNISTGGATITWTTDVAATSQVLYGTTTAYGASTANNASLVTSHSQTLSGLQASTTYHYSVQSANAAGTLSTSGDNTFTTSASNPPPILSAIAAGNLTASGAVITWTSDIPSTSQVLYGTSSAYGSSTSLNATLTTNHSQTLSGLSSSTTYHYSVQSANAVGFLSTSADQTFTTPASISPTGPVISAVLTNSLTSGSAVITWTTDVASTSQVLYGTSSAYGSSTTLDASLVTSHSQSLSGLQPSTTYHYAVESSDAAGHLSSSGDNILTTSAVQGPPVISAIRSGGITSSSTAITWTTDVASTSQVLYGTSSAYGSSTTLDSTAVTSHSQTVAGLQPATLYHYSVLSGDVGGSVAASPDNTFTTATATPGPVIVSVSAPNITSSTASITWSTNVASTSQVEYGTTAAYGSSTTLDASLVTSHSQSLSGLEAATTYHFSVKSANSSGTLSASGDNTFTTSASATAPVISAVGAQGVTSTVAVITWATDIGSTSQVEYGSTSAYGSTTTLTSSLVTNHSQILTGLQAATTYHFRVKSADGLGNLSLSGDNSLTTTAAGGPAAILPGASSGSNPSASSTTSLTGGCGMISVKDGRRTGPGQAADLFTLLGVLIILLLRKSVRSALNLDWGASVGQETLSGSLLSRRSVAAAPLIGSLVSAVIGGTFGLVFFNPCPATGHGEQWSSSSDLDLGRRWMRHP